VVVVGSVLYPCVSSVPRATPYFAKTWLLALKEAVAAQDSAGFVRAYDALTDGCNVCHRNHGYGFIAIVRPSVPVLTNQRYEP
jgi:hypothetical protein